MEKMLLQHYWLQRPNEDRLLMREIFNIPRTGGSVMMDGKLHSDGCTQNDLRAVTVGKMQEFLHSDNENFDDLLNGTFSEISRMVEIKKEEVLRSSYEQFNQENRVAYLRVVANLMDSVKKIPLDAQFEMKNQLDALLSPKVSENDMKVVESMTEQVEEVKEKKPNAKTTKKTK